MSEKARSNLELLDEGAFDIAQMLRARYPGVSDTQMYMSLAICTGMFYANAVYPVIPQAAEGIGVLMAHGAHMGQQARTAVEKEQCRGSA